jgi:hypothetical protein
MGYQRINQKSLGFNETPQPEADTDALGSPLDNISEVAFSAAQVTELCKNDLDFLAATAMPTVFKYFFPQVFKSIWAWVLSTLAKTRDFSQLAIGLPRGFGKTIVVKLIILYSILFTKKQFILVICENESKAVSIISDVMDMLNEPNIKAIFGDWRLGVETDSQAKKKFGFRGRDIIIKAAGAGTGIRGITEKNRRPDLMIFDDIQSKEDAKSEVLSDALESWMIGTAMKAKSPEGCLYLFIANMYPTKGSLLRRLKKNPNWTKYIVGGILSDGTSLWEDLQPITQLIQEYLNDLASGHPEIFHSEVLNDENATVNHLIDLSKIPSYPFQSDDISEGKYIIIDPAGNKATSDAVSIGYFEIHNSYPVMRKVLEGRFSPGETIREALRMALMNGVSCIIIESNGYQASLGYWFGFICNQMGIVGIQALEIYSGMLTKHTRIASMFLQWVKGEIYVHPDCRAETDLQVIQYDPLKRDNTDGILDLLTYATKAIELYGAQIIGSYILQAQESDAIPVLDETSNSPF